MFIAQAFRLLWLIMSPRKRRGGRGHDQDQFQPILLHIVARSGGVQAGKGQRSSTKERPPKAIPISQPLMSRIGLVVKELQIGGTGVVWYGSSLA
jgi:hypothetical protein